MAEVKSTAVQGREVLLVIYNKLGMFSCKKREDKEKNDDGKAFLRSA